ncbi:hypothetical protein FHX42_005277 [Saccharopolyspora lacisalsi]|uniref:Uncharacterized protein n=1 Tax=Halosaccharopolyspora lacisalsi TaxID=1000566 RepID=A0A839E4A4_9PSEU|nr:hypothetical protein [Halosaccharopolyspora lacisalsi]MBA8827870.1 hypothetical protein [Halosaccharopolyspora lacisalsi]
MTIPRHRITTGPVRSGKTAAIAADVDDHMAHDGAVIVHTEPHGIELRNRLSAITRQPEMGVALLEWAENELAHREQTPDQQHPDEQRDPLLIALDPVSDLLEHPNPGIAIPTDRALTILATRGHQHGIRLHMTSTNPARIPQTIRRQCHQVQLEDTFTRGGAS